MAIGYRHHLVGAAIGLLTFLNAAVPLRAQFLGQPGSVPSGEDYRVELFAGMWSPTPTMNIASDAFGISGSYIDLTRDLGVSTKRFADLRLRLRAGRRHRFRIDYLPVKYETEMVVERRLIFRGIAFNTGVPVGSTLIWKTWRLGYEYDVIRRDRGYLGLILDVKHTELEAALNSALAREFVRAKGFIPMAGATLGFSLFSALSVAAEITAIRLPQGVASGYSGRYVDFDVHATINLIESLGLQVGYRSLDLSLITNEDLVDLRLEGMYLGALLRF